MRFKQVTITLAIVLAVSAALVAQQSAPASGYLMPPKVVVDILDATPFPQVVVSPSRQVVALLERRSMPAIADLAQPMLRLAGARINPKTNGPHATSGIVGITFKTIADGAERKLALPPDPNLIPAGFAPDGKRFGFVVSRASGLELWVADTASGQARAVTDATLNGTGATGFGGGAPCQWLDDSVTMLCRFMVTSRGRVPAAPAVPSGPNIQETSGKPAPVRTYQDLLASAHDEALFEHYFTSQIATVDATTGARTPIGKPALFEQATVSPNGEFVLVARLKRPFSWLVPANDFPKDVEIWNRRGELVKRIADLPLADTVPINGVPDGPRSYRWQPTEPATLVYVEALDEGNPKNTVPHRDRVVTLSAPFAGQPRELAKSEYRFQGVSWTEQGAALLAEYDRAKRWTRTWILEGSQAPRKLWDMSAEDRYKDPGSPVTRPRGGTGGVILQHGDFIYLRGEGASPQGDRPFLDRLNLRTLATERLFRSDDKSYETVVAVLADARQSLLTRRETRVDPPNYVVRDLASGGARVVTQFKDPTPQLTGIEKQLITYDRKDGVKLSATLYLPPGYKAGERLPVLMWAYPREFIDPNAAGQVIGSPNRFTTIAGASHLLFLTQGYAVLDNPTMPIVGPGETANDTYVEQLVASAQAAVDKVVQMGVADRARIAIGGHSYGAFMTANLLAHSDLFRAGIARSGAYNRTLTPFGFQNELRTFWEAPEIYTKMSPFWYAHKVNEPILLIHGEADNNSGTFPIQSERFYMALKGHGATVRYVTLPHEAHGYAARESILHAAAEMIAWCETYVKHARPRETTTSG